MPRSMWSGAISFGMVNIPVKLFTAVSPKDVHFHQVHDADGMRIQYKRVCAADGKEVPYEHIAKGYEISPNQYVIIDPKELEALDPKATHSIDIESFADLQQIDPLHFEHSYYLVPDKGAAKAYALLLNAMTETKKVGIAKAVIRTKQYIGAVRPAGKALTFSTLYYADEIVAQGELEGLPEGDIKLNEKEVAMAKQLIQSLATKFDPTKYKDDYRERVMELIEKKAQGEEIVAQPSRQEPSKVVNLMEALEKSLANARKGGVGRAQAGKREPAQTHTKKAVAHHRKKHTA
jgi:DNA end-binding protein Ku